MVAILYSGPSWMTDEARKRGQWVVRKTEAPFDALNNESVWEGSTPLEALSKAIAAFEPTAKPAVDDSMEYDEDTIHEACDVLNVLRNMNRDVKNYNDTYKVSDILKDLMGKYDESYSDLIKIRFKQFIDVLYSSEFVHEVIEENKNFIGFLIEQVVDENYTLAHYIIKNQPKL